MTQKEVDRSLVLNKVKEKQILLKTASKLMCLSYPQTKRLWARYKEKGPKGLISKKRGRISNRAISQEERKRIVKIISHHYESCSPLFISEKLAQYHSIKYSSEFIRQLMIEYKLWFPKKRKANIYQRRTRREMEGDLIQVDASDHDWFEGRASRCHLHLLVDDATSKIVGGYFDREETTEGYYKAFFPFLQKYGRPINIYTDKRGTFVVNQGEQRRKTQFARAMKELDIKMITAHSPQAKGRIERAFGTLQERLVWEMRIKNICSIQAANDYLPQFFIDYNHKYSKKPSSSINAYRPLNHNSSLKYILCHKEERCISRNLEVQYQNQIYQLNPPVELQIKLKGAKVIVITTLDGELIFEHGGYHLDYECYQELQYQPSKQSVATLSAQWKNKNRRKPSKHHPWKRVI